MEKNLIPNSTQIPNLILDFLKPRVPEGECRCLDYICRRTFGFHRDEDRISLSQFVDGMIDRNNKRLDFGTGLSRPSVVLALKNLVISGAVIRRASTYGFLYSLNLEMDVEGVVKKVNQLRKLTKSGKESKPKVVNLLNLQKKGNIGNSEKNAADAADAPKNPEKPKKMDSLKDQTPMTFQEFIGWMDKSDQRHIEIIAWYADLKKPEFETRGQWRAFVKQNLRAAQSLAPYSEKQLAAALSELKKAEGEYLSKWNLYTLGKYLIK